MKNSIRCRVLGAAALLTLSTATGRASACGGFFCNAVQPVNQAAERIVFSENGDGTVTAVIQIQYEGPAESFAWLLPIPTAPTPEQFKVASDMAFQRLQQATNPQYTLTTTVEGTCSPVDFAPGAGGAIGTPTASPPDVVVDEESGPVVVEASGSVGPFDWEVISVEEGTEDPAGVAVQWLGDHDYAVPESTAGLVGPYLNDGLFLLAVKLTKQADAGSIRPIVITYAADKAMIPVKLTSVAANDDMGVMTWLLGEGRGVPENYYALELNEARLNWFNANTNYNQVIIEAANDAGGQGFVTEYAGDTANFASVVWFDFEEDQWQQFQNAVYTDLDQMFNTAYNAYASYEGFWDAVESSVTLSQSVSMEDFKLCPSCYAGQVEFSPSALVSALEELVIEPMRVVQKLIDAHPQMTRLYTTLSAEEMTVDPLFTFNPELEDVSNVHTATRIIECQPELNQFEAPWRIELPQGDVVRGTADQVNTQTWPLELAALPPNRKIKRDAATGGGKVLEDNSDKIKAALEMYNASFAPATEPDAMGDGGVGEEPKPVASAEPTDSTEPEPTAPDPRDPEPTKPNASTPNVPETDDATSEPVTDDEPQTSDAIDDDEVDSDDGGCSVGPQHAASSYQLVWAALGASLLFRRRRQVR